MENNNFDKIVIEDSEHFGMNYGFNGAKMSQNNRRDTMDKGESKLLSRSLSSGSSFTEKIFAYYLGKYYKIIENYHSDWLGKLELDIFLPELNIAVEYDGRAWHNPRDDKKKSQVCSQNKVKLFRIREKPLGAIEGCTNIFVVHGSAGSYNKAVMELLSYVSEISGKKIIPDIDVKRDDLQIQKLFINWQHTNSFASVCPELAKQWNYRKNDPLKPDQYSFSSNFIVWWICDKGHEWKVSIGNRYHGSGCPVCSGKKVIPGVNDLASIHPELIKYWDFNKNEKTPQEYTEFSEKCVWWKCPQGHSWSGQIGNQSKRIAFTRFICPECPRPIVKTGQKSFAEDNEGLLREWAYDLNKEVSPEEISHGSGVKVWWRCELGHTWQSNVSNRVHGQGCPVCSGQALLTGHNDLETRFPEIARQWDAERNGLAASEVMPGTVKKYWWICEKGHSYRASPNQRTSDNTGCPYCSGHKVLPGFNDLCTTHPDLIKEWDYQKNTDCIPQEVSKGSRIKVWWVCPNGHSYDSAVGNRANGKGCPVCSGRKVMQGVNDLKSQRPDIADFWDYEKNGIILPSDITVNCGKKFWWICQNGHSWHTSPDLLSKKKTICSECRKNKTGK